MSTLVKSLVLGSGPAGLTAAIYLARFGHSPLVLSGSVYGGQPTWTSLIENYPGFPEGISGFSLMQNMIAQAEKFGAKIMTDSAIKVDLNQRPFAVWTSSLDQIEPDYLAESLVIATGSTPVMLGLPEEQRFVGRGIAFCATCDGPLYRGKTVAVVGGGNSALEEVFALSSFADKVYLIHRRDTWKADLPLQKRLSTINNLEILPFRQVAALHGDNRLTGVSLLNLLDSSTTILALDGLFLAIGTRPVSELFVGQLPITTSGQLEKKFPNSANDVFSSTHVSGVFVAGDVGNSRYKQVIIAASDGAMAAIDANSFLSEL